MESNFYKFKRMLNMTTYLEIGGMYVPSYEPPAFGLSAGDTDEIAFCAEWLYEDNSYSVALSVGAINAGKIDDTGVWHILDTDGILTPIQFFKLTPIID